MKSTLLLVALFLLANTALIAQFDNPYVENYGTPTERYLAAPDNREGTQLLPVGTDLYDGNNVNTIYYGLTPSNSSNKPVLVFVHGYASSAGVWYEGRDNMYNDVYRDGYRSAFVSLAPNKHMWTNGNMLSNMIDNITAHYGVSEVIVVAWSKGGVDTDAAIVHFGANAKVSQAFTLSTPHFGTGIAELANSVLISLVNIIFVQNNDGTKSLKRGYMNYFRSITDGNSNNTVGYTTIGGYGNGPVARLSIPQGYLYLVDGSKSSGGNDGVVPYASSRRPGGNELFGGLVKKRGFLGITYYEGPDETDLDHFEVTRGGLVWPHIKANMNSSSRIAPQLTADAYNPNAIVSSNMQIVTSENGKQKFLVEAGAGNLTILMGQTNEQTPFTIRSKSGKVLTTQKVASERINSAAMKNIYEVISPEAGEYTIESDEQFAAIVMTEDGVEAQLNTGLTDSKLVYETTDKINLTLQLRNAQGQQLNQALVTGTIQRSTDLGLHAVEDAAIPVAFQQVGNEFKVVMDAQLPAGIYDITVNAKGKDFAKTVITSIALVDKQATTQAVTPAKALDLSIANAYPNPFASSIAIELSGVSPQASLTVYNVFGQEVKKFDLTGKTGQVKVEWNAAQESIESGLYILQLTDGKRKITKKVVMR